MTTNARALLPVPKCGLYALTPDDGVDLVPRVAAAIAGGARLIQYRDKTATASERRQRAGALLELCRASAVPLIINDDIDLAAELDADGVHLGRDDQLLAVARARLGPDALIGVSCYASLERARAAQRAGADYIAFGSFFPSRTKPAAPPCDLATLRLAAAEFDLPIVAIGGITLDNAASLLHAGASLLAVISAIFEAADIRAAANAFTVQF